VTYRFDLYEAKRVQLCLSVACLEPPLGLLPSVLSVFSLETRVDVNIHGFPSAHEVPEDCQARRTF